MNKTILVAAITAISLSATAENSGPYVGFTTGFTKYEETFIDDSAHMITASLNAGYAFNEYVSLEARLGKGLTDGELTFFEYGYYGVEEHTADISIDSMFSAFLKLSLPSDNRVTPYVLVGNTKGKATAEIYGYTWSETESDFSYGVGLEFMGVEDKSIGMNVEYVHYLEKNDTKINGLTVGIIKRF